MSKWPKSWGAGGHAGLVLRLLCSVNSTRAPWRRKGKQGQDPGGARKSLRDHVVRSEEPARRRSWDDLIMTAWGPETHVRLQEQQRNEQRVWGWRGAGLASRQAKRGRHSRRPNGDSRQSSVWVGILRRQSHPVGREKQEVRPSSPASRDTW